MAVWSTITTSQIEYSRIDADYYHPQYLQDLVIWNALEQHTGVSKLRQLISAPVRTGRTPRLRRIKDGEPCVPFIKTDTVREGKISFGSTACLPSRALNAKDYIPSDSVLVTIIGATPEIVGRAAIVRSADPKSVTNQNVAVISTNDDCDPYFLVAYLQTAIGRDQLWRHSRRTEQVNLNCREVERILVPCPIDSKQREIGNLVRQSLASADRGEDLFDEAQQLLEAELGLDKLSFQKTIDGTEPFSTISLSLTIGVGRFDAQCFSPDAVFYEDWLLKNASCHQLVSLLENTAKGRTQLETKDGPTDYCSIKHISGLELAGASKCRPARQTPFALRDDLLLAITGATIGKIGIIKRYDRLAFSGDLLRLRANSRVDPHYLISVLNHRIGQVQFSRWVTGSTNGHLAPRDIGRVLVPRLRSDVEKRIAELVKASLSKRVQSQHLLQQAVLRVQQLIEEAART